MNKVPSASSTDNKVHSEPGASASARSQLNIVIAGHVDHGKSTVIGRLLADTGSLPEGKLEDVKALCARNAKPFEYAFLLDALKDERSQGITIDSARCFFKTAKRDYIVIDAPGHIEFLKNMVSGAARAEAALLVICASEGIRENSRRHGYLVSMLGIRQVVVLVNKMDLVNYDRGVYESISSEYTEFLSGLKIKPVSFIPISARDGDNITTASELMPWYQGPKVLGQLDAFEERRDRAHLPLRFPVQDIYKFTAENDDRRIIAGTIETGTLRRGDEVVFLPSGKRSRVRSIEAFNLPLKEEATAGEATGVILETQIYIKPGEIMVRPAETPPAVGTRFRANIFWMGRSPLIKGKTYKLKLATSRMSAEVAEIVHVLDTSDLSMAKHKRELLRHDVGEVIIETAKPLAFDPVAVIEGTGRFVLVDNYEIAGGGIILEGLGVGETLLEDRIREREIAWEKGLISPDDRRSRYRHASKLIVITGEEYAPASSLARELERRLFQDNFHTYYLGLNAVLSGLASGLHEKAGTGFEPVRILGELSRIITDSGQIFITALTGIDDYDITTLKMLNAPSEILVVSLGSGVFTRVVPDLVLQPDEAVESAIGRIYELLRDTEVIIEYTI